MSNNLNLRELNPLAIVLDWAGTTVDFGSQAPLQAFLELFRRHGIAMTREQALKPMGLEKREHLRLLLEEPMIREQWEKKWNRPVQARDVDALYAEFIPLQLSVISDYSALIAGAKELAILCQSRGIKLGTTTGYNQSMFEKVFSAASLQGFAPEFNVTASEVTHARPAPWMALRCLERMNVYPPERCIKIGDTVADILEGKNAGIKTIGLSVSGAEMGLSLAEWRALSPREQAKREKTASDRLYAAGADWVVASVMDLVWL